MKEEIIVNNALDRLRAVTGIKGLWQPFAEENKRAINRVDGTLDFYLDNGLYHVFIEIKRELRNYQLPEILEKAKNHKPFMVVADHIFPTLKQELREHGIGYIDAGGNIYIKDANQLIWLDGQPKPKEEKAATNRAFTKTGLKTVFLFLINENAINLPHRVLADMNRVALGNIKNVIEGLKGTGFIMNMDNKTMTIRNRKALFDRWIAGYEETLKTTLKIGTFRFSNKDMEANWRALTNEGTNITVWGGEPAAEIYTDYLRTEFFTVYTYEQKSTLMNRWRLIPDENGNVQIFERFWEGNIYHTKDDTNMELPLAPPLLVYVDLVLTRDPRCIETAAIIYDKYLKDAIEKY